MLRAGTRGASTIRVDGATVREALDALVWEFPALEGRVRTGNTVPSYLNVFVDGEDVRLLEGLDTTTRENATILLVPAVAGGTPKSQEVLT